MSFDTQGADSDTKFSSEDYFQPSENSILDAVNTVLYGWLADNQRAETSAVATIAIWLEGVYKAWCRDMLQDTESPPIKEAEQLYARTGNTGRVRPV